MREYLVEVAPGRELLYRTPWALRAAMRSGEITAESRIFHGATSSWISITEHPEFRRFQAATQAPAWYEPLIPPELPQELVVPEGTPKRRGLFRGLVHIGAAFRATSGRASPSRNLDSAKSGRSPDAAGPSQAPPSPQPDRKLEPPATDPTRRRWTFYP